MMRVRPLFFSAILGVTLLALALPLRAVVGEIITTNIYLQAPDDVQPEDLYLAATTARVDGTVDGDLVVSAGSVEISGTVTGDVLVLSQGPVEVTGDIGGSLRGIARSIVLEGSVGADLSVVALSTRISGTVARDALVFGGTLEIDGEVGRDVNGRMVTASINGKIGHDLDIAVTTLTLGGDTNVTGDVLYRSSVDAGVASTVQIGGQFQRLPTRGGWAVELVLTLATIIGFLGFLFAGIVLIWLFRRTSPRAVRSVVEHPLRASLVGVGALILIPVLIVVLLMTLVGVPVAIAVLLLYVLLLVFGPIPAVTAIGSKLYATGGGCSPLSSWERSCGGSASGSSRFSVLRSIWERLRLGSAAGRSRSGSNGRRRRLRPISCLDPGSRRPQRRYRHPWVGMRRSPRAHGGRTAPRRHPPTRNHPRMVPDPIASGVHRAYM